jgi:hypothetical protein
VQRVKDRRGDEQKKKGQANNALLTYGFPGFPLAKIVLSSIRFSVVMSKILDNAYRRVASMIISNQTKRRGAEDKKPVGRRE